jgi:3-hydroxyisobutyrate dehydrogenase-like beta-hydroxyacid dehydrogenase
MSDSPIGLIGVGLLGTALAERMHRAGFLVNGYDPDWEDYDRFVRSNPEAVATVFKMAAVTQLASKHDTIVLCLPDSNVVQSVVDQIDENLRPGMLLIDATTGDPDAAVALAARLSQRDVEYIDATIAGSSEQARRGEAVIIMGGASEPIQRAHSVLESWSSCRFHVGAAGSGQRMKLIVNLVLGLNRAVLSEGLNLAGCCGVDAAQALDVLKATPAYSSVMDIKGAKMVAREFSPQARLRQHHKDVTLIRALARRHGAATPLSDAHHELLKIAANAGFADADNSAIIEAYARRNTIRR